MKDNQFLNSNNLTINVVEQKERVFKGSKPLIKKNFNNKISSGVKAEEMKVENNKEKKDFFPKINNNNNYNINIINNNMNKSNKINDNQKTNKSNIITSNEIKNNNSKNININNNEKTINSQINIQSMNNSIDNKSNNNINITEEFKIKLNNITKNDFEYEKNLPLIQKGSYLTSLPPSVYNNKNKSNSIKKDKYKESTKILKNLKDKEKSLNKEILSIKNKKEKLNNGYIISSPIEKNINNYEEKRLQLIENNLLDKLDEVKNQIKDIIQKEESLQKNKSSLVKNFLKKYENEENAEKLGQKYFSKNNNTQRLITNLQKDLNIKNLNRFKDKEKSDYKINEENEKLDDMEQKMLFLKEQKEKEKEIIKKRKKRIDEQMLKIKEQVKSQENQPIENYLFYKIQNDFEEKENLFYKNIKLTKKLDVVGKEELKELNKKFLEKKNELIKKAKEKTLSMKKCWHSRSLLLPKYKSPFLKIVQEDEKIRMEKEEEKQQKKNKLYENKKNYFKNSVPLPIINEKLRKDIIQKSSSMANLNGKKRVQFINNEINNINLIRKKSFDLENKRFKQSNNLKKKYKYRIINRNPNKSLEINKTEKKFENINGIDINEKINGSMEINNINKKSGTEVSSPIKQRIKKNPKEINYLKEFENKNKINNYNWDKYIDEDTEQKAASIRNVTSKIEAIDDKVERQKIILKLNGGFSNNQKLGNDLSNLLINSIKGKLCVIKAKNNEE